MIKIPDESVEAAAKVLHANAEIFHDILWDDLGEYDQDAYREEATSAIVAALNAWQGIQGAWYEGDTPTAYILPLTQENTDD